MHRIEYPRPQFVRNEWLNLNGLWQFAFDDDNIGVKDGWYLNERRLDRTIEVPFSFQSRLSGIHDTGFHDHVWYKRGFSVPKTWVNQRILLHFGAVDYRCWVYVNGQMAVFHEGGHTPFSVDITESLTWDQEVIVVHVEDPSTDETIPRGKQFWEEKSAGIWYTRTTGIWQTVWLEPVNNKHIQGVRFIPDIDQGNVTVEADFSSNVAGEELEIALFFKNEMIVKDNVTLLDPYVQRTIQLYNKKIFRQGFHEGGWNWSPEHPHLIEVRLKLKKADQVLDQVDSYFGMRKVHQDNGMVYLNNRPYYQKLVLDQGYWPDGLMTAPEDNDFVQDIKMAKAMGFNGCRKHQKVEDPRFLYWADRLGFIVWGECASAVYYANEAVSRLTKEWLEIIKRDFNHPSIVTWVPLNESWGVPNIADDRQQQHHSQAMYHLIHSLDPTRLVVSNDGWEHTITDICTLHNYAHGNKGEYDKQEAFLKNNATLEAILDSMPAARKPYASGFGYRGEPILLSECGGISFQNSGEGSWGYTTVQDEQEFLEEYERLISAIYQSQAIFGFCYTQLTDVEQETNGLLTYDRKWKVEPEKIKTIHGQWLDIIVRK